MTVVSVSMPEALLDRIDEFSEEHGYTGRSEVVREASRNLLGEFEDAKLEDRRLMAVVTVLFDYETTSVEERMIRLRHEHEGLVASNFHSHVGGQYCMELFVLEGSLEDISSFVGKVRATKDTLTVDYSVTPVDEFGSGPLGAANAHEHGGHGSHDADTETADADTETADADTND
ncbi:CopG family nickel-responsive transcriptional regulator [Halorubrum alkaliphilum]|uniref:Putative nickel-responsive regulator n=1 Tax=Halorubrum alkaliphilum TaxID=261290 RepID=A0A8T4GIF7_9EURY|nr:CopG family ribbon-helix-helix protein [Halorubrum alkaliphilum]MBP1923201.1 CopG family nickel-responsive transcriptional regulator [Halorubrum alkaliphilum]